MEHRGWGLQQGHGRGEGAGDGWRNIVLTSDGHKKVWVLCDSWCSACLCLQPDLEWGYLCDP